MRIADVQTGGGTVATSEAGPSLAELRYDITTVAGVASVDLDLRPAGPPVLRAQLDGTRPAEEVAAELQRILAGAGVASPPPPPSAPEPPPDPQPVVWQAAEPPATAPPPPTNAGWEPPDASVTRLPVATHTRLELVTVEETRDGVAVRAADSAGHMVVAPVHDPATLNAVIVSVIARLVAEVPAPALLGAELKDLGGIRVLTVVLGLADGRRAVGAAPFDGGMPFTLGRAIWEALTTSR
jgi:hypothetical protein